MILAPSAPSPSSSMLPVPLGSREFEALRELIMSSVGIQIADSKRPLLEGRLAKRLRHHGLKSYADYLRLLRDGGPELTEMVNAVTTNKTSFFRENHHFEFLRELFESRGAGAPLRIWSAGCSSGEEPYSIAITAAEARVPVRILATDVDTQVLSTARAGVYPADRQDGLAEEQKRRYFLRGVGARDGDLRVRPELQRSIEFRQVNLNAATWPVADTFDVIFCRNVIIYFDRPTQTRLFQRFAQQLSPGGLLILGHSESAAWMGDVFEPAGQTMYRVRSTRARATVSAQPPAAAPAVTPRSAPAIQVKRIEAGDVFASAHAVDVRTVLGSCVAACLHDPRAGVGGMNHFMLAAGESADRPARYGVHAMELLINEIMKLGGDRRALRAKVFGGARVIQMSSGSVDIGGDNSEFILRFLDAERIPVEAKLLGGTRPIEVHMNTKTGLVRARALQSETLRDLAEAERLRAERQSRALAPTDSDLANVLF